MMLELKRVIEDKQLWIGIIGKNLRFIARVLNKKGVSLQANPFLFFAHNLAKPEPKGKNNNEKEPQRKKLP
ncbi:hypothetical protein JW964_12795 [candidate division KSB1 bacterium]|nr:hypothetical protein [candidate division KSB1 bacterium]